MRKTSICRSKMGRGENYCKQGKAFNLYQLSSETSSGGSRIGDGQARLGIGRAVDYGNQ